MNHIHYFPIEIGFPLMIIDGNRGLIKIEYNEEKDCIERFKDVGYGIYPYVSEFADRYENVLENYFAFPIIVCNLGFLKECVKNLGEGIGKLSTYAKKLLSNRPEAIVEEICYKIFPPRLSLAEAYGSENEKNINFGQKSQQHR